MNIKRLYRNPALSPYLTKSKLKTLKELNSSITHLNTEYCFNVEYSENIISEDEMMKLRWLLGDRSTKSDIRTESAFTDGEFVIEIGPRLNFSTAFSTNAVSICHAVGITRVTRLEVSIRYNIATENIWSVEEKENFQVEAAKVIGDRMTECVYPEPIVSFDHGLKPSPWYRVDVIGRGESALREVNEKLGLSFTDWDIEFYANLFANVLKRNPTDVECFDLAQSNSEHSRHWFFKGRMLIDGVEQPDSLLQMVMRTQDYSNDNNVIKFCDNSSAISGFTIRSLLPKLTYTSSQFETVPSDVNLIFTAETHNFPTAVSPFSGAATGTGGRIRDVQAVGRGGNTIAGTVGYSVGNLLIPGYDLPWENNKFPYSSKFANPLKILIEASNGASDYGNKFGEPVIIGFTRSFGLTRVDDERVEYIKPILFSGGFGTLNSEHITKKKPSKGMKIVKLGGPVYRIGVGGGAASSTQIQGDSKSELDFGAVQRGDPEMEQKLNRVIRACIEMKNRNPILSIHDQGAGGNGNVLKEIVEPSGGIIFTKSFQLGDSSVNTLELWCAEYQENNAVLCSEEQAALLKSLCDRECCPFNLVGLVTDNGKVTLMEEEYEKFTLEKQINIDNVGNDAPVNLDLNLVLGEIPQKTFNLERILKIYSPLVLPDHMTVFEALQLVLRLPSVGSKRFLINKVDRSVTGLVVQQQCVGPLHTPVADAAVTAVSYYDKVGIATSIGEQPIKGLINPAAGARMAVAEALTNLAFAPISSLQDVKCSANWMWPAKLPGEGAALYESCTAMCDIMRSLNIAVDGGKDSLSMATRLDNGDVVKSPGTLVISTYVACTDTTSIVTPDLKSPGTNKRGILLWIDVSEGKHRLGGSALAQCLNQLGQTTSDVEKPESLKTAFTTIQNLIKEKKILSGHDISDGGFITCLLEMAFAGLCGLNVNFENIDLLSEDHGNVLNILFAEECGWILECSEDNFEYVNYAFQQRAISCSIIGHAGLYGIDSEIVININGDECLRCDLRTLLEIWEETSYRIEKEQMNPTLADEEFNGLSSRKGPTYRYNLALCSEPFANNDRENNIEVAVIREEGINGDREMVAALHMAGFRVWDVTMRDLFNRNVSINQFRGIIFPGGFSYADVLGSSKGWAASLLFNSEIREQFKLFYERDDTFSLGVCNGCQLMALLGWIGSYDDSVGDKVDDGNGNVVLSANDSGRFESRFSTVRICESNSIMLSGMEDSLLGVWVAHGEGKFHFKNDDVYKANRCIALKYVDEDGNDTEKYPFNPNGSPAGVAGLCSLNGRHLAVMPHPERCVQFWQLPYVPPEWKTSSYQKGNMAPWFQMFVNAYNWCCLR